MTREQVLNSIALKKRFVRDYNVPIVVFDNPYFMERLHTIDRVLECCRDFDVFCDCLGVFENEQDYFEYYNSVKDSAINYIKENPAYDKFNKESFGVNTRCAKRNLYSEENDGLLFFSIDMRKANFSALRYYDEAIFGGAATWEEFIGKFTSSASIINSKYIRQVILGACNPKRHITYEHYLMGKLLDHIVATIPSVDVYSLGEDEILIKVPECGCQYSKKELQEAVSTCPDNIGDLVRVELFELHKINGTSGWTKHIYDNCSTVTFKCLDAEIFHQIIKHFYKKPITKNDLVFFHNGQLATFLREVENPWKD